MKNVLKKMAKQIAKMFKAMGRGASYVFGSGGAPGQTPAVEVPTVEAEDGDDLDETQDVSKEIKPSLENYQMAKQVQVYNAAFESMDFNTRVEAGDRMTGPVKAWVSRLSDNDRAVLKNCSAFDIANHLSGMVPIEGIAAVGQGAVYDTRPVPFGKKITQELVAARKPEGEVIDFTSRKAKTAEKAPDVDLLINDGKPLSKYDRLMMEQIEKQDAFAQERRQAREARMSEGPKPPKSMMH
ncbi:hypothetical protein [Agrobacterium tumefaciens]|uniref:hypothetical protein n=1 Tax=Agrobacterium tumefaciens TaxID=358 RepID=UPI0015745F81|nr:hypothetical protein [Agrobacterium tumefaciens]